MCHAGYRAQALLHLLQKNAHRAEEQARGLRGALLQADLVADQRTPRAGASPRVAHLLGHALRDGDRRDPARLGDDDAGQRASAILLQQRVLQDVLRHLRRLPAARGAAYHHDAAALQAPKERVTVLRHRQARSDPLDVLEVAVAPLRLLPPGEVGAESRRGLPAELHEGVVLAGLRPDLAARGLCPCTAWLGEGTLGRLGAEHPLTKVTRHLASSRFASRSLLAASWSHSVQRCRKAGQTTRMPGCSCSSASFRNAQAAVRFSASRWVSQASSASKV
mmetsp:Transcript_80614/g.250173  ORF Transcript_80614/g.250173 Transcript_80614/m.250173 type:complete len:278 (+) Transcript_80614:2244-3077(+)